ncbi:hypothetical protein [Flavobacterium sp. N1719]|uniref:hypothetical protein n=1 Tax=Flavobacterium sp. N1719 TaxID=2885633 RepID=UPI0022224976|nr:hypothetical protein [Flavobacterium sp. N1719]
MANRSIKIVKVVLLTISSFVALLFIAFFVYKEFFYKHELYEIKGDLEKIKGVEVVDIWGHEDITLEEISARLKIAGKGEISLYDLSSYKVRYPSHVYVHEIGNYSFTQYSCDGGIGPGIDVGAESVLGKLCKVKFYTPKDIVQNYDQILNVIQSLKMAPELNHFETDTEEFYLIVQKKPSSDEDPIFNLIGIEDEAKFAATLKWNKPDCYYNK